MLSWLLLGRYALPSARTHLDSSTSFLYTAQEDSPVIKLYVCSQCSTLLCRVVISRNDEHLDTLGMEPSEFWIGPPGCCLIGKCSIKPKWKEG